MNTHATLFAPAIGFALTLLVTAPALAATRTVTLSVPGLDDCTDCPLTVRTSLQRLHGLRVATTDLKARTITVEILDAHVTDRDLTAATANAGYPSRILADVDSSARGAQR